MAPWEDWEPCELKVDTKQTVVPLPFPFDNLQIVVKSSKQENEAQAKVELQDQNGNCIKTLTSAYARINTCT